MSSNEKIITFQQRHISLPYQSSSQILRDPQSSIYKEMPDQLSVHPSMFV